MHETSLQHATIVVIERLLIYLKLSYVFVTEVPGFTAYIVSKVGIFRLTELFHQTIGRDPSKPGMLVNSVSPHMHSKNTKWPNPRLSPHKTASLMEVTSFREAQGWSRMVSLFKGIMSFSRWIMSFSRYAQDR